MNYARYTHFPRQDLSSGDTILPVPENPTSALACLFRYTKHLHEYLDDTLSQLETLNAQLAAAEMPGLGSSHQVPPFPPQPNQGTFDPLQKRPASAPARFAPFRIASSISSPPPGALYPSCHIPTVLPSYSLASPAARIDTEEGSIDLIPPATPLEMEPEVLE